MIVDLVRYAKRSHVRLLKRIKCLWQFTNALGRTQFGELFNKFKSEDFEVKNGKGKIFLVRVVKTW